MGVGILSMATDRARKRWVTKLVAAPPTPAFSRVPPFSSRFPPSQHPEGNVVDFSENNRRVRELRPAQTRSRVAGLDRCMRKRVWSSRLGGESLHFGALPLRPRLPSSSSPRSWREQVRALGPEVGWGRVRWEKVVGWRCGKLESSDGKSVSERCCFWPPALSRISPPPLLGAPKAREFGVPGPSLAPRRAPLPRHRPLQVTAPSSSGHGTRLGIPPLECVPRTSRT